jgi:hypothetical protein
MNVFRNQRITMAGCVVICLAILGATLPLPAPGQTSQTNNPDWPLRSFAIHWPDGYTPPDGDLFAHNEVAIQAPCSVVWNHLVKASSWPEWYPNPHTVRLLNSPDGRLHPTLAFHGIPLGSTSIAAFISSCQQAVLAGLETALARRRITHLF